MREWKGGNSGAFDREQRRAIDSISTQLYELTAAAKLLSGNQVPTGARTVIVEGGDHGALSGLEDDDHPQYPLSAGRSGGQHIYGGLLAGTADSTLVLRGNAASTNQFLSLNPSGTTGVVCRIGDTTTYVLGGASSIVLDVNGSHSGGLSYAGTFFRVRNTDSTKDAITAGGGGSASFVSMVDGKVVASTDSYAPLDTFTITSHLGTASPLVIRGAASQSDNLTEWRNVSNTLLSRITSTGVFDGPITSTGTVTMLDTLFRILDNGDNTKQLGFECSGITTNNTRILTVPNADGTIPLPNLAQTWTAAQTLDNAILYDSGLVIKDAAAPTSILAFSCNSITPGNTRTLTIPDASGTIALTGLAQTFSAHQTITEAADTTKLIVKGHSTQTTALQEWQDSTGTPLSYVGADGGVAAPTCSFTEGSMGTVSVNADGVMDQIFITDTAATPSPAIATIVWAGILNGATIGMPLTGGTLTTLGGVETLTNKTLATSSKIRCLAGTGATFQDNTSTTKQMRFDLSGITAANTRNVKFQDTAGSAVLVGNTTSASGVLGTISYTARGSDLTAQTLLTGNASSAGLYRVSFYLKTATGAGASTIKITLSWNEGTAQTMDVGLLGGGGSNSPTAHYTGHDLATTGAFSSATVVVRASASQNITFTTTAGSYASSPTYDLEARIEALG